MTQSPLRYTGVPETLSEEPPPRRRTGTLVLAALAVVAILAAACSSTPSASPGKTASQDITSGLNAESIGQAQNAITDFKAAVTADPADTYAYYDLGVVYQTKLNQPTQASDEYNKALLADPTYKPALFNLAILETPNDPQGAISLYNKLLVINPNDANTNFNLGLLLIAQNQATQGHADLAKAIMVDPSLASRVPKGITP